MFPGIDGFHWTAGHLIFLCLFYAVLAAIFTTLVVATTRAVRDARMHKAEAIRWLVDFHDLPLKCRFCRHVLTGEFRQRICENAFDCRHCATHAALLKQHPPAKVSETEVEVNGLRLPLERLYHRGHTWVRQEADGMVTVGLDAIATRLVGAPERVELPQAGALVAVNGTGWKLWKNGAALRVLSPVDGTVMATGGPESDWYLKIQPAGGKLDARNLLRPDEVGPWARREMERLRRQLSPNLADGGVLMDDLSESAPKENWETAASDIFLQV